MDKKQQDKSIDQLAQNVIEQSGGAAEKEGATAQTDGFRYDYDDTKEVE